MNVRRVRTVAAAATVLATAGSLAALTAPTATADSSKLVYTVHPITRQFSQGVHPGGFPTPSQCTAAYGIACYTPAEIRTAYDIPAGYTGKGTSIAIVDAYGSPTAAQDLATFSDAMGLPQAKLNIYCPTGCPSTLTSKHDLPLNWAGETSLDLQWAHAIAPEATLNLVVASSPGGNVLNNAVRYAVDHHLGDTLSMSYGAPEAAIHGNNLQVQQAHRNFADAAAAGISVFASSGDDGAANGYGIPNAGYPASDPLVTSVGGTNLFTDDSGNYQGESVWNDDSSSCPFGCAAGDSGATGGAPSKIFDAPAYQSAVSGITARTTSDVSYDASVYTSVLTYEGFNPDPSDNGFYFFGGTSSGSPQWAAIGADAVQAAGHDLGQLNPKLYALAGTAAFHDVTDGDNKWHGPGFDAGAGYDIPTGLGSPDVAQLVPALTAR